MKLFFTGPMASAEMLVVMLEKHGIPAVMEDGEDGEKRALIDPDDLNRLTRVLVSESDYPRAHDLFYKEREDEL